MGTFQSRSFVVVERFQARIWGFRINQWEKSASQLFLDGSRIYDGGIAKVLDALLALSCIEDWLRVNAICPFCVQRLNATTSILY